MLRWYRAIKQWWNDRKDPKCWDIWDSDSVNNRRGFVLPAVLFVLVILFVLSVTGMATSSDDARASHYTKTGLEAFYVAEAGARLSLVTEVPSYADTMAAGATVSMPWADLAGGFGRYRTTLTRTDNDTVPMAYLMRVTGERHGAQRTNDYLLTPAMVRIFGAVGESAATVRGDITVKTFDGYGGGTAWIDGKDRHPVGWPTCAPGKDKPGLVYDSGAVLIEDGGSEFRGDPPTVEQNLSDSTFSVFGELGWAEFRAMADHVIGCPTCFTDLNETHIYPRYTVDSITGAPICDTSHPYNWGSPIKPNLCAGYMPIIVIQGEVDINRVYGQGIWIVDWNGGVGSEFDIEQNVKLNGIILGRGCVEIQEGADVRGTIFVDGTYSQATCSDDATLDVHDGGSLSYSSCAIDRVLTANGLGQGEEFAGWKFATSRYFQEVLQ